LRSRFTAAVAETPVETLTRGTKANGSPGLSSRRESAAGGGDEVPGGLASVIGGPGFAVKLTGGNGTFEEEIELFGKGEGIARAGFGGKATEIGADHLFVFFSGSMHGMTGIREFDTGADEGTPVEAIAGEPFLKREEEAGNPVGGFGGERFHFGGEPLAESGVFTTEGSEDQVVLGGEVLVDGHTGDAGFGDDGVDADGVKSGGTKHALGGLEEVVAFADGHNPSIRPRLPVSVKHDAGSMSK
jgi:hypothetical protein